MLTGLRTGTHRKWCKIPGIDLISKTFSAVAYRGGGEGFVVFKPPEILKALQNRAKLNSIVKNVKNC